METIKVFWKGKFGGELVSINALEFNPYIHRREADGPWPVEAAGDSGDGEPISETDKPKSKKRK